MKSIKDFVQTSKFRQELADSKFRQELADNLMPGYFMYNADNILYEYVFGKTLYNTPLKYSDQINESLTMTFDPNATIRIVGDFFKRDITSEIKIFDIRDSDELNSILNKHKITFDARKEQSVIIKYKWSPGRETIDAVKKAFQFCGYYFSHEYKMPEYSWLYFYPKFQVKMNSRIRAENKYLFHITTADIAEKIKKNGFIPKSASDLYEYPGRVHFLFEHTPESVKLGLLDGLARQSKNSLASEKDNRTNFDFVEIKIDVSKLPLNMNFFTDPDFSKFGVFTYDNIKPDVIVEIRKFNL